MKVGLNLCIAVYGIDEEKLLNYYIDDFLEKIHHLPNIARFYLNGEVSLIDSASYEKKFDAEYEMLKQEGYL